MRLYLWREAFMGRFYFLGFIWENFGEIICGDFMFWDPSAIGTSPFVSCHMIRDGSDCCDSCKENLDVFVVEFYHLCNLDSLVQSVNGSNCWVFSLSNHRGIIMYFPCNLLSFFLLLRSIKKSPHWRIRFEDVVLIGRTLLSNLWLRVL